MAEEQWRPVVGHERFYEVSDRGRVRSLPRVRTYRRAGDRVLVESTTRLDKTWILHPKLKASGYLEVSLKYGKTQKMAYVHRMVLDAFTGPPPTALHQAAHINGKRADNRSENLIWATRVVNMSHQISHGTRRKGRRQIDPMKQRASRLLIEGGMSDRDASMCLRLKVSTIRKYAKVG